MSYTNQQAQEMQERTAASIRNSRLRRAPARAGAVIEHQLVVQTPETPKASPKRIRQGEKPPNKLEADWLWKFELENPTIPVFGQSFRVRIANGAWFKVDYVTFWPDGKIRAHEIKGPKEGKNVARGLLALKVAAGIYPQIEWFLNWRESGSWKEQRVLA
jgi:hypothetical protein